MAARERNNGLLGFLVLFLLVLEHPFASYGAEKEGFDILAKVVADTKVASLRRFQEDVREVQTGFECGILLEDFVGFQVGDVLEFYHVERAN